MNLANSLISSLFLGVILILSFSCTKSLRQDSDENSSFILIDSLSAQCIAEEPLIVLPVAMQQDRYGNFWVIEMPGFMRDIDGNGEDIADGRIVILSDENQNGDLDNRHVFLDSLLNPRALRLVYEGLLYTDGYALKWCELSGEVGLRKPKNIETIDSFYVIGGNIEHQPNGLLYGIDNWIYSAKSNVRYRRFNGEWQKEVTTFRGQWGITQDKDGRLISNNNAIPFSSDVTLANRLLQNQFQSIKEGTNRLITKDFSVSPYQASIVNRGYDKGVLDEEGKLVNLTSACSPLIYTGDKLGPKYQETAFVCAPEVNQILQYDISYDSLILEGKRSDTEKAFLLSKEEVFRPVNLITGLDGYLYVVDLRKGIIQHRAYMTDYLRKLIEDRKLDEINWKGRLYRISEAKTPYESWNISKNTDWISMLGDANLERRLLAQQQLIANKSELIVEQLRVVIEQSVNENQLIHAMWTLEGMDEVDATLIIHLARRVSSKRVKVHTLYIIAKSPINELQETSFYELLITLNDVRIDYELCHNSSRLLGLNTWNRLAEKYKNESLFVEALLSGLTKDHLENIQVDQWDESLLKNEYKTVLNNYKANIVVGPKIFTKPYDDDRTNGLKIFNNTCSSCHGMDGRGLKNLAPSLAESSVLREKGQAVARVILNGYTTDNSAYNIPMPAYKNDPNMSNQDIVDLVSYLKSSFSGQWSNLQIKDVENVRKEVEN